MALHEPAWLEIVRFDDINMAEEDAKDNEFLDHYVLPNKRIPAEIVTFICRHSKRSIAVHCEQGISRSEAVCRLLNALGWDYCAPPARPFGHQYANLALVRLLQNEVVARRGTTKLANALVRRIASIDISITGVNDRRTWQDCYGDTL